MNFQSTLAFLFVFSFIFSIPNTDAIFVNEFMPAPAILVPSVQNG